MQYTCRVYSNTGFNAINVPDSPALLNQMSFIDYPVIDLNQERFLPNVRIRASWDNVKNADYCKVGDFFYFVDNVNMTSGDVALLTLSPDFLTSAGGFTALEILDGVTSRVHVSDDTFGLYGGDDPYMAPAYDMDVISDTTTGDFSGDHQYTFIETTLDLVGMGFKYANSTQDAITAIDPDQTDPDGNSYTITYPKIYTLDGGTNMSAHINSNVNSKYLMYPSGQGVFLMGSRNAGAGNLLDGIEMARSLNIEQSISGQYAIPESFVSGPNLNDVGILQSGLSGKCGAKTVNIPFKYGTAKNNRVFYGSQSKYFLCSAAGNVLSANAEEIYNGASKPIVRYCADPRRTGKPYFRFNPLNGISLLDNEMDMFRNCVAGKEWLSVPMVLTGKSGSLIDTAKFNASQQMGQLALNQANETRQVNDLARAAGLATSMATMSIAPTAAGGTEFAASGSVSIGGLAGGITSEIASDQAYSNYVKSFALAKAVETQQFLISQNVYSPSVNFGGTPDLLAEATGNGFIAYRNVYKQADITRIDKILTAYGYKHSKVLEQTDFYNRQYFNYVESSISVGNLPRWWANGISAQIGNGVRIWHVKPNHAYYTNNPVRV